MGYRFNPPPNWPAVPPGWTPPPGWQPAPEWPAPPKFWQLWTPEPEPGPLPASPGPAPGKPGLFSSRKRVRELEAGLITETANFHQAVSQVREFSAHNAALSAELADLKAKYTELRDRDMPEAEREIRQLRQTVAELQQEEQRQRTVREQKLNGAKAHLASIRRQINEAVTKLHSLRGEIAETEETALAVAYKAAQNGQ